MLENPDSHGPANRYRHLCPVDVFGVLDVNAGAAAWYNLARLGRRPVSAVAVSGVLFGLVELPPGLFLGASAFGGLFGVVDLIGAHGTGSLGGLTGGGCRNFGGSCGGLGRLSGEVRDLLGRDRLYVGPVCALHRQPRQAFR